MQKYLSNNKGFTLVEVIVVAVIVMILAATAIPLYNGYIRDSRQSALDNAGMAIANAFGAAIQAEGCIVGDAGTTWGSEDDATAIEVRSGFNNRAAAAGNRVNWIHVPRGMNAATDSDEFVILTYINDRFMVGVDEVRTQFTTTHADADIWCGEEGGE